ncbi:MAG: hypothetical protein HC778_01290 [Chamaesiphon sp. CSU_1_12]|nr:hypothetical protein [Chamaesiphon sp. CSU_1_12]
MLVQVRSPYSQQIQPNARVKVLLNTPGATEQVLFTGQTDAQGLLPVNFTVPPGDELADPNQTLMVVADTNEGQFQLQQEVYVGRVYNLLVSTDKPVYQPGQTIHLRGLALESTALRAAQAQTMTLTVADPEGNKLLQQALLTSQFGIAAADFVLGQPGDQR